MAIKKIFIFGLISLILAFTMVGIYRYYLLNKTSRLADHIPSNLHSILYIQTRVAWKQLSNKKLSNTDKKTWKQLDYFKHIQAPEETGLDFLSDAAIVEYQSYRYGIMLISDRLKFETSISHAKKGLFENIQNHNEFSSVLSLKDSFTLVWNNDILLLFFKSVNPVDKHLFSELLSVKKNQSFRENSIYHHVAIDTVSAWFYTRKSSIPELKGKTIKGSLLIRDGLQIFATEDLLSEPNIPWPHFLCNDSMSFFYTDSNSHSRFNSLIRDMTILNLGSAADGVLTLEYEKQKKMLILMGKEVRETRTLTYEYDDEFNRVERIHTHNDSFRVAFMQVLGNETHKPQRIYNSTSALKIGIPNIQKDISCCAEFNETIIHEFFPISGDFRAQYQERKTGRYSSYSFYINSNHWMNLLLAFPKIKSIF